MNDSQIADQNVVVVDMMEGEEDKRRKEDPDAEGNDGGRATSHRILNLDVDSRILRKKRIWRFCWRSGWNSCMEMKNLRN